MNKSLNCVLEVVQMYLHDYIFDQPLLFWLLLCSHFIYFFYLVKKRKPLFSKAIEMKLLWQNCNKLLNGYIVQGSNMRFLDAHGSVQKKKMKLYEIAGNEKIKQEYFILSFQFVAILTKGF